jgi:plastocyanin
MHRSGILLLLGIAMGCSASDYGTSPPPPENGVVDAVGVTAWSPTPITIRPGDDVIFRNSSATAHNLRFDDIAGHPSDVSDFTYSSEAVAFPTVGRFTYHCGIHPVMQGVVVVEP